MKKSHFYPFAFVAAITLQACKGDPINVTIDNPTKEQITFELDEKKISIEPTSAIAYKSYEGKHKLRIAGKEKEFKLVSLRDENALINPTGSPYILKETLYELEGDSIDLKKLNNIRRYLNKNRGRYDQLLLIDTIDVSGVELTGLYLKISDVVIAKQWDYGTNEKVPNVISNSYPSAMKGSSAAIQATEMINGYQGKVKIYREMDLLRKLLEDYESSHK